MQHGQVLCVNRSPFSCKSARCRSNFCTRDVGGVDRSLTASASVSKTRRHAVGLWNSECVACFSFPYRMQSRQHTSEREDNDLRMSQLVVILPRRLSIGLPSLSLSFHGVHQILIVDPPPARDRNAGAILSRKIAQAKRCPWLCVPTRYCQDLQKACISIHVTSSAVQVCKA
jgi:hypothetical protein